MERTVAAGRNKNETSTHSNAPQKHSDTAHIIIKFVSGESTWTLLKCRAVTGTEKTITLKELDTIPIIVLTAV